MEVWLLGLFLLLGGVTGVMSGFFGIGGGDGDRAHHAGARAFL